LLDAWRHLDGRLPLKIIGDGPLAAKVERAAAQDAAIQWVGSRPQLEVYQAVGEAVALVLPSQCYENFPRVIVEAYAKGTPVIASKLGAMAELVDDGRTGLHFRPGDSIDLAEKVRQLLRNPLKLARMRRAARQEFAERFNAKANYQALMAIYDQAKGGPPLASFNAVGGSSTI
jgi:glycosyltransferase involved in cell wall biosynthesis